MLASLTAQERQRLEPFLEEVELKTRLHICYTGQPITHVVFPHDAVASTLIELPEGDSVEVGLVGRDGFVGLDLVFGSDIAVATVIIQVPGHGVHMTAEAFRREVVERGGPFSKLLLKYARIFYGAVAQTGACNASHAVEQRLARWLLMVQDRVQTNRFPLTHEFIALMLGVRRASVTQAANALRLAGAIGYDRGEITIVDRELLEQNACGCYHIVAGLSHDSVAEPGAA
ncbi:MAG TPA: Crp/Fnr family transcriptional regulator [Candidatus Elarobacter sp.]